MNIGFSTNCFPKSLKEDPEDLLGKLLALDTNAIELHLPDDLRLISKHKDLLRNFEFRSVHLPSDIEYKNNRIIQAILNEVDAIHDLDINIHAAVVHPDIVNPEKINQFTDRSVTFCFENMDIDKKTGRSVYELLGLFSCVEKLPSIVLDLNHLWTCLNSLILKPMPLDEVVQEFAEYFDISHIHVSDFGIGKHTPFSRHQYPDKSIVNACPRDKAVIIESQVWDLQEAEAELRFIQDNLLL